MSPKGKYFRLRSHLNGLYLDVSGGSTSAGTPVIMWEGNGGENQVWYHHPHTKTIRSKASGLCLDASGGRLVISHHHHGNEQQSWVYNESTGVIENVRLTGQVLDIRDQRRDPGAELCMWAYNGGANQMWHLEPVGHPAYFYIRTDIRADKVMDISGGHATPGTRVILYEKKFSDRDNQLWYEDYLGNIRPKLNQDLVLDGSDGEIKLSGYCSGNTRKFWFIEGHRIVCFHDHDQVLDVKGGHAHSSNPICVWAQNGGSNQKWHFDYV